MRTKTKSALRPIYFETFLLAGQLCAKDYHGKLSLQGLAKAAVSERKKTAVSRGIVVKMLRHSVDELNEVSGVMSEIHEPANNWLLDCYYAGVKAHLKVHNILLTIVDFYFLR